jgi:hypothetical protein
MVILLGQLRLAAQMFAFRQIFDLLASQAPLDNLSSLHGADNLNYTRHR